jgi:hypothetical protein
VTNRCRSGRSPTARAKADHDAEGCSDVDDEAAYRRDPGQGVGSSASLAAADRERSGQAKSITDPAAQEGVTDAYVCRLLPLTCVAPDIVEGVLDGRQPKGLRLAEMLGNGPLDWSGQRRAWGLPLGEQDVPGATAPDARAACHQSPAGGS